MSTCANTAVLSSVCFDRGLERECVYVCVCVCVRERATEGERNVERVLKLLNVHLSKEGSYLRLIDD